MELSPCSIKYLLLFIATASVILALDQHLESKFDRLKAKLEIKQLKTAACTAADNPRGLEDTTGVVDRLMFRRRLRANFFRGTSPLGGGTKEDYLITPFGTERSVAFVWGL